MIRLPPTSISLSESDVQLHFREINIYQSLLQQGFTRDAIQQYYASLEAPGSEGHASSQNPRFAITKNAKSNEDGSLPKRDHPASSRYLDKHTPWPAPPTADDSGEVVSTATGAQQSQQDRTSQAVPRKVEYAKVDSQKTAKQTAHKDRSEDTGSAHTDTDIVEISTSGNAESFAPSTVELRAGAKLGSKCFPDLPWDTSEDQSSSTGEEHFPLQGQEDNGEDTSDLQSPPLASNLNLRIRSRPRQSSMLHITRNAASPSSSGHSDDSFKSTVTKMPPVDTSELERSPLPRTMTYRARSQTYPWVQSEADECRDIHQTVDPEEDRPSCQSPHRELDSTVSVQISVDKTDPRSKEVRPSSVTRIEPSPAGTIIITSHRRISTSSPLRAEADDFVPLKLPSPFSATRRVSSGLTSLTSIIRDTSPSILQYAMHARSSPNLTVSTPPRSSSIGSTTRHLGSCFTSSPDRDFPSSPPRLGNTRRSPEVGPSRRAPTTPGHREREAIRETQPRVLSNTPRIQERTHQTDGPGTVYDDRVPAYLQPKTPADLTRGVHVTVREAAYTAPPGRTARTPATISQTLFSPTRPSDPGEESPSRRARTIRERRERELRRSAILEEEILGRFRELEGDPIGGRMHWDGPGHRLMSSWRDDFGADRLGEENFDEEGRMRTPRVEPWGQRNGGATRRGGA